MAGAINEKILLYADDTVILVSDKHDAIETRIEALLAETTLYDPSSFLLMFSLLLKELIFNFYLSSLQLVLCRVATVKRLPVHQS